MTAPQSTQVLNLSALKHEIIGSKHHLNPQAAQLEALANYHGFKDENGYPDIPSALSRIESAVCTVLKKQDLKLVQYAKLNKEDRISLSKKGDALVKSGCPQWVLDLYGQKHSICFLFVERDERRSKYKVLEALGDVEFFHPVMGHLESGPPHFCTFVLSPPKNGGPLQIYELLKVSERDERSFVDLIIAALTPPKKQGALMDFIIVEANSVFQALMPDIESAIDDSLAKERKKWYPVK